MSDQTYSQESMSEEIRKNHRKFAVDCFNATWDLLDKSDRTEEENTQMIHTAHASRYHWGQIGTPLEFARGDWQISRVYAVLGIGDTAFHYGESSLNLCLDNNIADFDLAFAYEALSRASAILGDTKNKEKYIQLATKAGEAIQKEGNRTYFFKELKTV